MDSKSYKEQLLLKLYAPYISCTQCPLGKLGRTNIVFGDGNPDAKLMFIGEGPGKDEDMQGKPFVGRSGKLLTKLIELAGMQRKDVFISNVVKCRPPENRKPTEREASICTNLLLFNQIKIIKPRIICTLGASALQGLINNYEVKISHVRGCPLVADLIPDCIILPTFHPAYILRNPRQMQTMYADIEKAISLVKQGAKP